MAAPFATKMMKNVVEVVALVVLVMPLVVYHPTAVRVVHALDGDSSVVRVGSGIFPIKRQHGVVAVWSAPPLDGAILATTAQLEQRHKKQTQRRRRRLRLHHHSHVGSWP